MPPQENNIPPENNPAPESNSFQQKPTRKYVFLMTLTILLILTGVFGIWYFSNPLPEEETETLAIKDKFADSSTSLTASWKTYRNEEYGFEFKYPINWSESIVSYNSSWMFQSSSTAEIVHGIGIPSEGAWINVVKGVCNGPTSNFVADFKPDTLYKTVCENNFQITLNLWQKDQNLIENKKILNQILSTFKFIK